MTEKKKSEKSQARVLYDWRNDEIIRLYQAGLTGSEISQRVGISRQRVNQIIRTKAKHVHVPRGKPRKRTCPRCKETFEWNGTGRPLCPNCDKPHCAICGKSCTRGSSTCWNCFVKRKRAGL